MHRLPSEGLEAIARNRPRNQAARFRGAFSFDGVTAMSEQTVFMAISIRYPDDRQRKEATEISLRLHENVASRCNTPRQSRPRDRAQALAPDEVSALLPEYPSWMLATQGADRLGPADLRAKSVVSAS